MSDVVQQNGKGQTRPRFYYGWVVVLALAVINGLARAFATLNFGLFIKPMGDELGIGRAAFGWAQTARQVGGAVTSPTMGRLVDKIGSRLLIAVAAAITGAVIISLAYITKSWQLVLVFGIMGMAGLSGPVNLMTTVPAAKWFVRKRGKAMSMVSTAGFMGAVLFVLLSQVFISAFGWRVAWILLGVIGTATIIPLALLFVRRQPEDMGLRPDGDPPVTAQSASAKGRTPGAKDEVSWTLPEVLHTRAFWLVLTALSIETVAMSSVGVHRIPHFMDRGMSSGLVAIASSLDATFAAISSVMMGILADKMPARFLGAAGFLTIALSVYLTIISFTATMTLLAMATFGLGVGGIQLMQNFLWADYFGREHLGRVRGIVMPVTLAAGGIGAPLSGYVRDTIGTYEPVWWAGICLMVLSAVLLVMARRPARRQAPVDTLTA